jgi:hypothetical protein
LDPNSALYKMYAHSIRTTGVEENRKSSNSDLQALIWSSRTGAALRSSSAQCQHPDGELPRRDDHHRRGLLSQSYYAYRDTENTGEWHFLPWDVDLTFGRNWTEC